LIVKNSLVTDKFNLRVEASMMYITSMSIGISLLHVFFITSRQHLILRDLTIDLHVDDSFETDDTGFHNAVS